MALTSGSKILVSDISTALGGKIDTAGTGLSKSGTTLTLASLHSAASTIGSSSAQTLAYSGTFTIPYVSYDVHGRVSGGGTRTITMPAKPSGGTATAVSNVITQPVEKTGSYTLPSGGTWNYSIIGTSPSGSQSAGFCYSSSVGGSASGGTKIKDGNSTIGFCLIIAIRVA